MTLLLLVSHRFQELIKKAPGFLVIIGAIKNYHREIIKKIKKPGFGKNSAGSTLRKIHHDTFIWNADVIFNET